MSHEAVLVSVATNPVQLSDEQVAALSFGTTIEKTVEQVGAGCQRQCDLGGEICRLSLTAEVQEEGSPIVVASSCADCPNPAKAQLAVSSLVNFADRRIAAINDVELSTMGPFGGETVERRPFLHRVEDPIGGNDYHVISAESLDLLAPTRGGAKSSLAAGLINALQPEVMTKRGINPDAIGAVVESPDLSAKLNSRSQLFIVAERIDKLVLEEQALRELLVGIGNKTIELLKAARQKTIELGIAQSDAPLGSEVPVDTRDPAEILIRELDISPRALNCLVLAGIQTEADLLSKTERDISAIPNAGKVTVQGIKGVLAARGRKLVEED